MLYPNTPYPNKQVSNLAKLEKKKQTTEQDRKKQFSIVNNSRHTVLIRLITLIAELFLFHVCVSVLNCNPPRTIFVINVIYQDASLFSFYPI